MPDPTPSPNPPDAPGRDPAAPAPPSLTYTRPPVPPDAFDEIVEEDNRSLAAQLIVIGVLVLVFATLLVISKLF